MSKGWIIVTGATGGIGLACVTTLCLRGYGVVASASSMDRLAAAFPASSPSLQLLPCDLSQTAAVAEFCQTVQNRVGAVAGMICAAGVQRITPLGLMRPPQIADLFLVNTFSAIELVNQLAKKGRTQSEGASIVLVSSLAAHEGAIGNSVYAATKGALEGFLPAAAAEMVSRKVRLNIITPGYVETPMTESFFRKAPSSRKEEIVRTYPLGLGQPKSVADLAAFLISEESSWITGQRFVIDGGHSIRS